MRRYEQPKNRGEYHKMANEYLDARVICKCGRRMPMPAWKEESRCSWCGKMVKNTSKARFKYIMLREMGENNDKN